MGRVPQDNGASLWDSEGLFWEVSIDENIERTELEHNQVPSVVRYSFTISNEEAIEENRKLRKNEGNYRGRDRELQEAQTLEPENKYEGFHESKCKEEDKLSYHPSTSAKNKLSASYLIPITISFSLPS